MSGEAYGPMSGEAYGSMRTERMGTPVSPVRTQYADQALPRRARGRNSGVCVFDFDGTIRLANGRIGEFVQGAIEGCMSRGHRLAIVSASHDPGLIKQTLQQITPTGFPESFFTSGAFQVGQENKTPMINKVKEFYNIAPECMVLLDDANKHHAMATGIGYQNIPHATGIRAQDFEGAMQTLHSRCQMWTDPVFQASKTNYQPAPQPQYQPAPQPQSNEKCPNLRFPASVVPQSCANMGHGQTCQLQCQSGFQTVGGSSIITCINGKWDTTPLQCVAAISASVPRAGRSYYNTVNPLIHRQYPTQQMNPGMMMPRGYSDFYMTGR